MTCWCEECKECWHKCSECTCGWCSPCAEKKECCVPNIVWGNCIDVTTDSKWVITISTECNPEVLSSDWTVKVTKTHDDIDHWDLSINDSDKKVWACDSDKNPWTLDQKLVWVNGITITPICSDNGKVQIGFDHSTIQCEDKKVAMAAWCTPDYLWNQISVNSRYIQGKVNWCTYTITDKDPPAYYAKLVLAEWHDWIKTDVASSAESTQKYSLWNWWAVWETVYNKNMAIENWRIKITRSWLYNVGFSWSFECWSWIHAFRVQLYSTQAEGSDNNTLIESRYSAPVWTQPFEANNTASNISQWPFVTSLWLKSDGTVNQVNTSTPFTFRIDNPLWGVATDVEWTTEEAQWKSASLWSYISRMPVWNSTIVELKAWDYICIWVKASAEVRYTWDILWRMADLSWHIALLCKNSTRSWWKNTWPECWLSFFASLMHPLDI